MSQSNAEAPVPVVIVARNNLELLQGAVRSALDQDVPTSVLIVDNGSTDSTSVWLQQAGRRDSRISYLTFMPQHSVSRAWNTALKYLFTWCRAERVLVINQDVVLRPDTVRWLQAEKAMFVTAVGSADPDSVRPTPAVAVDGQGHLVNSLVDFYPPPRPDATRPHPDFSCFMISRECYERVGPFDESFLGAFAEDADMHVRMHAAGIHAYCIDLPFWHIGGGSQTVKRANPEERQQICEQADRNRELFKQKHGFAVGSAEYYAYFGHGAPDAPADLDQR